MALTQINKAGLDEIALDHVFTIGASGTDHYTFQGEGLNGTVNDPTLYLTRGKTYRFENGSGGHPIRIQSTSGASGTAYNTGVTNNAGSGTVIVEVQHDAPDVLYYQCTSHPNMNGILYITGALADGGVTTAKLADQSVTTAKLGNAAAGTDQIAHGAIVTIKLADNAVTTTKIADSQITTAKINDDAVTAAKLADSSVQNATIATGAVTTAKINDGAVTTAKIANDAVTGVKIAAEIDNSHITATANIAGSKLADNSISLAKLEHGTSSNDGKFLRANNGADPTFETVTGTTINNNADNRVITGSGTANTLEGEANLTYDGSTLKVDGGLIEIAHSSCHLDFMESSTTNHRLRNGSGNFQIQKLSDDKNTSTTQLLVDGGTGHVELRHNGSKKIETTSYGTKITGYQSTSSYIGFYVRVDGNNNGFGTSHGSSITTYDVDYYSPIPMFNSRSVGAGNSYLQFPSYASGEYIKFTAPVAGVYMFELMCSWETHAGGDWLAVGWEKNTTSYGANGSLSGNGQYASGVFTRTSVDSGGPSHLQTIMWMDTNDYAVLYQQSCEAVRWGSNEAYVRGTLIN